MDRSEEENEDYWSIPEESFMEIDMGQLEDWTEDNEKDPLDGGSIPFLDFISLMGLDDLQHLGCPFTWSGTRQGKSIFEELDRAMSNFTGTVSSLNLPIKSYPFKDRTTVP
ncbi:hypothetical protein LIER_37218 [Lithospermum erythrorhizon]|uniref:Uncharacterized protein n=1 Tax=Lithospermum erythrorhizon TaxID=34254 RepID=A0AAV3PL22_LITER